MKLSRLLAAAGAALLSIYIINTVPLRSELSEAIEAGRMKNVTVSGAEFSPAPLPSPSPLPEPLLMPVSEGMELEPPKPETVEKENIMETTIQGGLSIKNETAFSIDIPELLRPQRRQRLSALRMQVCAVNLHCTAVRFQHSRQDIEQRCFAAAGRTENRDKFVRTEINGYAVQRVNRGITDGVGFGNVL